ncbi:hypothetical protein PVK06_001577 [Gossypium arboreum]|uniref:Uncharacterized protein n=1 Tax=Gossypium arboreum TaxID=29729 RepID=A0ABR0R1C9_GOSAR|nr:hypothetical protein PVK06_001577 [Gossypium arboreum]
MGPLLPQFMNRNPPGQCRKRSQLKPSTHNTTVTLDRMCLIHSIIKDRKIDIGAILYKEIAKCAARQTRTLVSDNDKEEESIDIEEYLRKIDSLFKDGIFVDQEDTIFEKEVAAVEEEVVAEEEKVVENEKEKEEKDSIVNIVTTPKSMGANIDNLDQDIQNLLR